MTRLSPAERRRRGAARQARCRANRRLVQQAEVNLGLPPDDDWRAKLDAAYPIPFGWTITCARAWAVSGAPQPQSQQEADAWRAGWIATL